MLTKLLILTFTLLVSGIALTLPALVFFWSYRALPSHGPGWHGVLYRGMAAMIFAMLTLSAIIAVGTTYV